GNSAYWSCEKCGKFFSDAEGKTEIEENSWVIPAPGEHSFGEWTVTREATCEEAGEQTRTCSICGEVETEVIEAVGHDYVFVKITWSGTAAKGYTANANYKCDNCGGTATVTATMTKKVVEPTCVTAGTVTYTATVSASKSLDGAKHTGTKKVAGDPATGEHNYGEYKLTKSSKNTYSGLLTKTCEVCGKEVTMTVNPLVAKGVSSTSDKVKITWNKVKGATRYHVFVSTCGKSGNTLVGTTTELTFTKDGLKKNTYYKFQVVAQRKIGGKWKNISTSYLGHFISGNTNSRKTVTNAKSITLKASTATVKVKKTFDIVKKLTPKTVMANTAKTYKLIGSDHAAEFRYTSSDSSIATVTKDGVITGVKAGTCTVYVVSVNGVYKAIKVTVTK
ncbi:MAG: Ig-like domain-containing protein, partial [Lachnospiraceae bacterium]|nr:Ig-like domain-containing protein [Lachnospiraceae bacterium]